MKSAGVIGTRSRVCTARPTASPRGSLWILLAARILVSAPTAIGETGSGDIAGVTYTVTRLSDRVLILDCLGVNVTAIAADSGIIVVDTNRSRGIMAHLRHVIAEQFGREDFAYVINTHGDPDHAGGNWAFPGIPLVAHRDFGAFVLHAKASTRYTAWSLRNRLEASREEYERTRPGTDEQERLKARIAALELMTEGPAGTPAPRLPSLTFVDSLILDVGDLKVELRYCGDAHTNHDIICYVPEEKLLLSGDLISTPQSPGFSVNAMADVPRLVGELENLLRRETGLATVVPGHGTPLNRADLSAFCRSLAERFSRTRPEDSAALVLRRTIESEGVVHALDRHPAPTTDGEGPLYWSEEEFSALGERLMRQGQVAEALRVLRRALEARPGSALLHDCLGDAYVENDDVDAAIASYERSLALMPQNQHARDMLAIIR